MLRGYRIKILRWHLVDQKGSPGLRKKTELLRRTTARMQARKFEELIDDSGETRFDFGAGRNIH